MKNFARFAVVLCLLWTGAAFAAELPAVPVADEAHAVATEDAPAVEAAPEQAEAESSPLMSTVLEPKKKNVDYADCIVCCRAIFEACSGSSCFAEWQTCKQQCGFSPDTCL